MKGLISLDVLDTYANFLRAGIKFHLFKWASQCCGDCIIIVLF